MARARRSKNGSNKSQAIREMSQQLGRKARPRDVIAGLKEKGIEVSPALVTNVLSRAAKRRGRKVRRLVGTAVNARRSGGDVSMASLVSAKKLIDEVGSVDEAKRALDALARLI